MDKKTKQKWLKALRSGEYKQGRHTLREDFIAEKEYCCLGVLCDLVEPNLWRKGSCGGWRNYSEDAGGMPRKELQKRLGLDKKAHRAEHDNETIADTLADMNDRGCSFKEIANWIEKRKF